jgi:hypothetical protein
MLRVGCTVAPGVTLDGIEIMLLFLSARQSADVEKAAGATGGGLSLSVQ